MEKRLQLTRSMAEKFYEIHKDQPFYDDLSFMISGLVVVQVLEGENVKLNK